MLRSLSWGALEDVESTVTLRRGAGVILRLELLLGAEGVLLDALCEGGALVDHSRAIADPDVEGCSPPTRGVQGLYCILRHRGVN